MCMAVLAVYPQGKTLHFGVGAVDAPEAATFTLASCTDAAIVAEQLLAWLEAAGFSGDQLEFIVTSGHLTEGPSGIYRWTQSAQSAEPWAGELCTVLSEYLSCPVYLIDPASSAECHRHALVTGTPAIQRPYFADYFIFKYLAREEALRRGLKQREGRFIVAHLDTVNQLGAVVGTRVVDCLTSADEGPFALYHSGGLPFDGILRICDSAPQREQALQALTENGGLRGYLGLENIADFYSQRDEQSELIRQALVYQIAKEIGALAAALQGQVDAIICAGELARFEPLIAELTARVGFVAPLVAVPGQQGVSALLAGARRVWEKEPIMNLS